MFNTGRDDVAFVRGRFENTRDRGVVALRAAARKDQLGFAAVEKCRRFLAGLFERRGGDRPNPMQARRITEVLSKIREYCVADFGGDLCRRVVIEIDQIHWVNIVITTPFVKFGALGI